MVSYQMQFLSASGFNGKLYPEHNSLRNGIAIPLRLQTVKILSFSSWGGTVVTLIIGISHHEIVVWPVYMIKMLTAKNLV